ncbi:MAG: aminoacyltransferase [Lactococcus lactis]|nr:aminoacyltransferase [Lactococcus lactis]
MLDQEINEQLGHLQNELKRLKTVTDYIDGAKENSISIITELEKVQQNYAVYTDKIFNLYKQYVTDLKQNTEIQINDGVLKFETTGNKIDTTNKEKLVETKRLLEQYKKIVEATDSLVKTLESVDFPTRLSSIDTNLKAVNSALNEAKQSIEKNATANQTAIIQRLDSQDKEIKSLKTILFVICGLIVIGTIVTIFVLK